MISYEGLRTLGYTFLNLFIIVIIFYIISIVVNWKLFKKAGKSGWEALVPFYSSWTLVEIAGLNWWWFLLIMSSSVASCLELENLSYIASLMTFFASFNCYYNIAKKFNKSTGYSVCAGIFSFIFSIILVFSKNETYDVNAPVSKNGIFGTPESPVNNSYQNNYNNNIDNSSQDVLNNAASTNQGFCFCGNCGTKLSSEMRFCPVCGKQIN